MTDNDDNCKVCKARIFEWHDFAVYRFRFGESFVRVHVDCEEKLPKRNYELKTRVKT